MSLTKLQETTKNHILEVYKSKKEAYHDKNACYLLADEVGLGKTNIAASVIKELAEEKKDGKFVVYYICGNQRVTRQNKAKLCSICNAVKTEDVRLSMQKDKVDRYKNQEGKIIILPLTPATTFTNKNSEFNQEEFKYFQKMKIKVSLDKETFLLIRQLICKYMIQTELKDGGLKPDMVLLDEFQNFDKLLYDEYPLFKFLMKNTNYTLMLSATPYQMLNKEIRDLKYIDIIDNSKDTNAKREQEEEDECEGFRKGNDSFQKLVDFVLDPVNKKSCNNKLAEDFLYENVLCRSERSMFYDNEIKDDEVDEEHGTVERAVKDMSYTKKIYNLHFPNGQKNKNLLKDCSVDKMIAYSKKAPHFSCFATRYTDIKGEIDDEKYCKKNIKELEDMHDIPQFDHARMNMLKAFAVPAGIEKLLWIPPTIFRFPDGKVFENFDFKTDNPFWENKSFTKTLVFGNFRMETAAPAMFLAKEIEEEQNKIISATENNNRSVPLKNLDGERIFANVTKFSDDEIEAMQTYYKNCFIGVPEDLRQLFKKICDRKQELINSITGITDNDNLARCKYAVMGALKQVLEEYMTLLGGKMKNTDDLLKYEPSEVIYFPDCTHSPKEYAFVDRYTEDNDDKNAHNKNHADNLQLLFNSPFYPFVMTASAVAQEGLDLHWYSHSIAHWSIPKTPIEYMQREGRIDRYASHLVRKRMHLMFPKETTYTELLNACEKANTDDYKRKRPLFPYWYIGEKDFEKMGKSLPPDKLPKFRRLVCTIPLSSEDIFFRKLQKGLQNYNAYLGPTYQEQESPFNLCPFKHEN